MLVRTVELIHPPLWLQPRIDRLYKEFEFLMIFVSLVAACALAILFGIADVFVSLYRHAVVAYNTFMPASTMSDRPVVREGTGSHRARSNSPTRLSAPAAPAAPAVGSVSKPMLQYVTHNNDITVKPRTRGTSGRYTTTTQVPVQQNDVYDAVGASNSQSVRKRKASENSAARGKKGRAR